ncbi:MAG: hypothetical protein KDD53_02265 [Bdellovibrionales bacterium]|nr:hypothetical protein [Bdellovibrionales bacterium]
MSVQDSAQYYYERTFLYKAEKSLSLSKSRTWATAHIEIIDEKSTLVEHPFQSFIKREINEETPDNLDFYFGFIAWM